MKFLTRYYYLPFLIGIIFSILFWISSIDMKLKVEGFAQINTTHEFTRDKSTLYWALVNSMIVRKYNNNESVKWKRKTFRFTSKNNDKEEIINNYRNIKNEYKKYKKIYLDQLKYNLKGTLNKQTFTGSMRKKIKEGEEYLYILSQRKFLGDLKVNEVIIRNYHFIYITLLVSFLLSLIAYNLKYFIKFK